MSTHTTLPQGQEKYIVVQKMFDDIAPTYEKTNSWMTFGLDRWARRQALKELRCTPGSLVIDLASGTGDLSRMMSEYSLIPISCDYSFGMLQSAQNIPYPIQADGAHLPIPDSSCNGVICGYAMRNFVNIQEIFAEIMRILTPGGRFVAIDVTVPSNPIMRIGNKLWFNKCVPTIGRIISKNNSAYRYLPRSTAYLPSAEVLKRYLLELGAENVQTTSLVGGSLILLSATKA